MGARRVCGARQSPPGSPGETDERCGDAGTVAAGYGDGLAGSNRICVRLRVAGVLVVEGGWRRGRCASGGDGKSRHRVHSLWL